MSLTEDEIATIAEKAGEYRLPLDLLAFHAKRWLESSEVDGLIKRMETTANDAVYATAKALFEKLKPKKRDVDLGLLLFDNVSWLPAFRASVGPILKLACTRDPAHQALFGERDLFIDSPEFEKLIMESAPRVCLLVGDCGQHQASRKFGTGFLVGPSTILTARHVFDDIIATLGEEAVPGRFLAVFDFDVGQLPRTLDGMAQDKNLTVVRLHKDWLLEQSHSYAKDGQIKDPTPEQLDDLKQRLDFALVRLAEPVGQQPVKNKGTAARKWFNVTDVMESNFDPSTFVVIWQHPGGVARCAGTGRVLRSLQCGNRVLYDANSSEGSSGAPCLNTSNILIGMHNASYQPSGIPEANQAIRIDAIKPKIANFLGNIPLPGRVRPWKVVTPDGAFVPIFGRGTLIDWIMYALDHRPDQIDRRDRVYAVFTAMGAGNGARARDLGRSFTAEILQSALAGDIGNRICVLGGAETVLPDDPVEVIQLIGAELGIPQSVLDAAPKRPSEALPLGADDGDKLVRWASKKLPEWFLETAEAHRGGQWQRCWIAFDDLSEHPMSALVESFVAGLITMDRVPQPVSATAQRLHWLFLGKVPGFLEASNITTERVDGLVTAEMIRDTLEAAYAEKGAEYNAASVLAEAHAFLTAAQTLGTLQTRPVSELVQQFVAARIVEMDRAAEGAQ